MKMNLFLKILKDATKDVAKILSDISGTWICAGAMKDQLVRKNAMKVKSLIPLNANARLALNKKNL